VSVFNGSVETPYWFDPVRLLGEAVGTDDPRYIWWRDAIGGSLGQSLIDMNQFCAQPAPAYPDMTVESIQVVGLGQVFYLWMVEYLYSITTSP
jgi:hypothetical protein